MTDTLYNWSETAASNDAADATINWVENQDPNTVNNSARAVMARLRQLLNDIGPTKTSTGTGNSYAITSNAAGAAYVNGEIITFIVDRANTSSCTLNVDARGALPWRPGIGLSFNSGDLIAGQPVTAFYNSSAACWYSTGTGYHVSALSSGISLQSITARMPQIGDMVISLDATVGSGRIRLTQTTQSVLKTAYPELNSWLSARSYPWGSDATNFSLPPAAGYFLRFAPTSTAIDTAGARAAGATQTDTNKTASVPVAGITATSTSAATSTVSGGIRGGTGNDSNSGTAGNIVPLGNTAITVTTAVTTTTSLAGSATLPGGDEVRVKNVAFHIDIVASTALSAAQIAVFGFPYKWDTGITAADPGAGRVRGNNATLASITALYINNSDQWAVSLATLFATFATGSVLTFSKVGAQANRLTITLTGASVSGAGFYTFPCSITTSSGTLSSDDNLTLEGIGGILGLTGPTGPTGPQGVGGTDPGVRWNFDSSTVMADPGTGDIRFNHATLSLATAIAVSDLCGEAGNPDLSQFVLTWDDSTSTTHYGTLVFKKATAPQNLAVFKITGATVDNVGWSQLTVVAEVVNGSFTAADVLSVQWSRTGNKGTDGAGSGDVVGPASALNSGFAKFDGTTGKLLKSSPVTIAATDGGTGQNTAYAGFDALSVHGADIASAATINLDSATGYLVDVTGVTGVTAITLADGRQRVVRFTGILTLTHGASLILPGAVNITTAAGDYGIFAGYAAGVVRLVAFTRNAGIDYGPGGTDVPVADGGTGASTAAAAATNLGLGTTDSPMFTGVNVGHATDTTITRTAAGKIAVEGFAVKLAGTETIYAPAVSLISRTTNGAAAGSVETATNKIMLRTLDFDTTTQEFAQFGIRMPKSWNEGTITAQFTWSHAATTVNFGVVWALEAVSISDLDPGDAAFGTAQQIADTGGTTNTVYITAATPAITIAGTPAAEDWVVFQVKRVPADASDNLAIDARLHGVTLYITTDASDDT